MTAERYALHSLCAAASCRGGCTDYTHVIVIGANDLAELFQAFGRYTLGGDGYVDPVAFEDVFDVIDGVPTLSFAPVKKVGGASVNGASLEELIVNERSLPQYGWVQLDPNRCDLAQKLRNIFAISIWFSRAVIDTIHA